MQWSDRHLVAATSVMLRKALSLGGSILEFEGFYKSAKQGGYYGVFLWQGMVTFSSGRVQPVFYRMPVVSPDISGLYEHWKKGLERAYEMMQESMRLGRLLNYRLNGSPTRAFKSVVWQPFGCGLRGSECEIQISSNN